MKSLAWFYLFVFIPLLLWISFFSLGGDEAGIRGSETQASSTRRSHVLAEFVPGVHSSDVSFIRDTFPAPLPASDTIPVLAIFVRAGTKFLERCVRSIDYPVRALVIIQDTEDDSEVATLVSRLNDELAGKDRTIMSIRRIVNYPHSGCAQAWNTVYRLFPTERFWLFNANDVAFPPGQLGAFYGHVRIAAQDDTVGMISSSVDFGNSDVRKTFGLMTWAVTRQGVLRGGLYDENFYPGSYEDDDIVWRFWLAGLKFYALPGVITRHGDGATYESGTSIEDKRGEYVGELARTRNKNYFSAKWGPKVTGTDYAWLAAPGNRAATLAACASTSAERYCSPFNSGRAIGAWDFSEAYRACVRDENGADCMRVLPSINAGADVDFQSLALAREQAAYDRTYAVAQKRRVPVLAAVTADAAWDPERGWGNKNQAVFWDLYEPLYNCHNRIRLGRVGDGGKWVCNLDRLVSAGNSCLVYSYGSNGEISFEEDLIEESGRKCAIHVFDPVIHSVRANNRYFNGPEAFDLDATMDYPGITWHTTGLGPKEFEYETARFGKMAVERLSTTMARLGHAFVDILKIDTEGYEWEAFLSDIFASEKPLPFGQLLIEVHIEDFGIARKFFDIAETRGLRMFFKEPVQYASCSPLCRQAEICFVNIAKEPRIY